MYKQEKKVLPPTYFMISLFAVVIVHFVIPIVQCIYFPWNLFGLLFLIFGGVLNLLADKDLKKYETTVKPFEYSSKLITDGIFSFSRNPMYLGMSLILLGESILFGSLSPYVIVIIFTLLIQYIFIKVEEEMLLEKFGTEFIEYKSNVRSWF